MALIEDQPEGLPSSNDLDNVEDPDQEEAGERAEIYLSGAHVATLDNAPRGLGRVTLMVELEVTEEATRFTEDGHEVPIRRCRRIGDMWIPGTPKPPTRDEIKAMAAEAKAKAQAEQLAAERAEQEENEPPMFDEDGEPIHPDAPTPPADDEDQGDGSGDADDVDPAESLGEVRTGGDDPTPAFSG